MKDHQGDPTKEAWVICLVLGIILINFPFIHIFNDQQQIFGMPPLVLYFLIGWPASIGVIWLFVRRMGKESPTTDQETGE